MPMRQEFRLAVRTAIGNRPQREVAELTGISLPYVNRIMHGHIPSREMLVKLAEGLGIVGSQRAGLFGCAGYDDPAGSPSPDELPAEVLELAREIVPLTPKERALVRRLIQSRDRLGAIGLLMDQSVIAGPAFA